MLSLAPRPDCPTRLSWRVVVTAASLAACSAGSDSPPGRAVQDPLPGPGPLSIALSDHAGEALATLRTDDSRHHCDLDLGGIEATIARRGDRVVLEGEDLTLTLAPGPAGPQIVDATGTAVARLGPAQPSRLDVLGMDGIAQVRIRLDEPGAARLLDRASVPVATMERTGGRFVATGRDGTVLAYVQGTDDAAVAALLASAALPPDEVPARPADERPTYGFAVQTRELPQRALLACDRLLAPVVVDATTASLPAPVSP